jgi:hypothetical protein
VVADASTSLAVVFLLALSSGCVEGGNLAISAGAPVSAAVGGQITDCGRAVVNAEVVLAVQQDLDEQARPVDSRIGPQTTGQKGDFLFEVSPSFAIPGSASMQLQVTIQGVTHEIPGGTLEFRLGAPPQDTVRFNADIGTETQTC